MNWLSLLGLDVWLTRWHAAVLEGVIATEDRLELAHLEWQQLKLRLRELLVLTVAVAALTVVALTLLSAAVIVQFWDTPHRLLATWLVAGAWLILWAIALASLLSVARSASNGFALTRRELLQDWRDIKERL